MRGLELVEVEDWEDEFIPQSRKRRGNPRSSGGGMGSLIVLGGIFYLVWCALQYNKTKIWTWTPWKIPVQRFKELAEHKVKPPSDNTRETITLIVP